MAISKKDLDRLRGLYPFQGLKYVYDEQGHPSSVLLNMEDFVGLLETLDILSDQDLVDSIQRGLEEIRKGKPLLTHSEVFGVVFITVDIHDKAYRGHKGS
jgi:hypothetical protein